MANPYQSPTENNQLRRTRLWWLPWFAAPFLIGIGANGILLSQFEFHDEITGIDLGLLLVNLPALPVMIILRALLPPVTESNVYYRLCCLCLGGPAAWGLIWVGFGWLRRLIHRGR